MPVSTPRHALPHAGGASCCFATTTLKTNCIQMKPIGARTQAHSGIIFSSVDNPVCFSLITCIAFVRFRLIVLSVLHRQADGYPEQAKVCSPAKPVQSRKIQTQPPKPDAKVRRVLQPTQTISTAEEQSGPPKNPRPRKPSQSATCVRVLHADGWRENAPASEWPSPGGNRQRVARNAEPAPHDSLHLNNSGKPHIR